MTLDDRQLETFAARLDQARRTRTTIPPLTDEVPGMTMEDGYRVQRALLESRTRAGERVAGWKVGLTTTAGRAQFGIDESITGPVVASAVHIDGAAIDTKQLIAPRAEVEIAFVLRERLVGPGVTPARALLAVQGVVPALEIIDCRYHDWTFKGPDALADACLGAAIVLGTRPLPLADLDLALEGVVWEHNGEIVGTATGAEVGGTPLGSLVWLANRLATWGTALHPGEVVLSGSLSKVLRLSAGDAVRARFTRLGTVAARFV
jgi:2-keto-4-pentenoate hydratase